MSTANVILGIVCGSVYASLEITSSHLRYLSKDQRQYIVVMWQLSFNEQCSLFSIHGGLSAELRGPAMFFIKQILQNLNLLCCLHSYAALIGRN